MEKFTLINKDRSRIKVFEPFEDVSKPIPNIVKMMINISASIRDQISQL